MSGLRRRDWLLIGLLLASSLICARLGFWQLARLQQRLDRNTAITNELEAPLRPFSAQGADYQRVTVTGKFLQEYEILLQNRSLNEVTGFHLVTPLQAENGLVVLVDRGWIPYDAGSALALDPYATAEAVTLEGVLLPGQSQPRWAFLADPIPAAGEAPLRTWRVIDIEGIQGQMPFPLHDQYIALTQLQATIVPQPVPDFQPDLSNGPHLSYAIQWFSFAAIAVIGGVVLLRRALREK